MGYLTLAEAAQYLSNKTERHIEPALILRAGVMGQIRICAAFGFGEMYNATEQATEDFKAGLLVIPPGHLFEIEAEGSARIQYAESYDGNIVYFPYIERTRDHLRVMVADLNRIAPRIVSIGDEQATPTPAAKVEAKSGLPSPRIANAFDGLYWSRDKWAKNLGAPPKWLEECRVARGSAGKAPATWNPALIAVALHDRGVRESQLNAVFVRLPDWQKEWRDKADYLYTGPNTAP